jgi:pimeloyl-ACP methyl ester carboxylesterase
MAGDIHSLVRETLSVGEPISLVGHDLGSTLALGFALRYRDDVVSVTFMEAARWLFRPTVAGCAVVRHAGLGLRVVAGEEYIGGV